jgi:Ca2+-binding EF-hand superfamily protein
MTRRSLLTTLISATATVGGTAFAQTASASKQQDKLLLANQHVEDLLLLMDADKDGKISKQEWMNFMEAEFNRLDKDGKGELDLKDLRESRLSLKHARAEGSPN